MIMISSNFIFNLTDIYLIGSFFFFTKLLTLDVLFSTEVRAIVVAKLVMLGTSFLTSFILAWTVVLVAKFVIPGILSSIFLILSLYTSFLTTFFHHLVYLNQQKQVLIYQHLIYILYFLNCLN